MSGILRKKLIKIVSKTLLERWRRVEHWGRIENESVEKSFGKRTWNVFLTAKDKLRSLQSAITWKICFTRKFLSLIPAFGSNSDLNKPNCSFNY